MNTPHEHREFTRIPTALDADVIADGQVHRGTTRDVSMKGLLLAGTTAVASGQDCAVVVYLGGRGSPIRIRAAGRIARTLADGVAVEFRELIDPESYQHLANLVRYNAKDVEQVSAELDGHLGIRRKP
jgi:hypothetical protein